MALVYLDAGHGGTDVGAIGVLSQEAANMLKVALFMKPMLESYGHKVILSRSTNVAVPLWQRARNANNASASIFVSLHQNSASNNTATGFETFVFNGGVSNHTLKLQNSIHNAIAKGVPYVDRGRKRANFQVLRDTAMPAVLIEYGFINNRKEEQWMLNNLKHLAELTVKGINDYYGISTKPQVSQPRPKPTPIKPQESVDMKKLQELEKQIAVLSQRIEDVNNKQMRDVQKDDMKKLLRTAYERGDLHVDHSVSVDDMNVYRAFELLLSLYSRQYLK